MPRLIAFLRAINVGGRTVTMANLRTQFETLGFTDVETFLASGNVIFTTPAPPLPTLAETIEGQLDGALGFEVKTFLRSPSEVHSLARHPTLEAGLGHGTPTLCVAFLAEPLTPIAERALMALRTDLDDFVVHGREFFWLSQTRQSESVLSNAVLEKALGVRMTLRGFNTLKRLAKKIDTQP